MCPLGRDLFWPQGYNLNKLGRGPLGDARSQISRVLAFWVQTPSAVCGWSYKWVSLHIDPPSSTPAKTPAYIVKFSSRKSIFSLYDIDLQRTRAIWTILIEGHPRIIVRNYFKIGLGVRKSCRLSQLLMDGRTTDKDQSQKLTLSLPHRWAN